VAVTRWEPSNKYDLTGVNGAQVFRDLPQGIKLRMVTGQIVEILENAGNGANLLCRFVENEENPSSVGEEEYVFFTDVKEVVEEGAS
jgi:hypothetical protein